MALSHGTNEYELRTRLDELG